LDTVEATVFAELWDIFEKKIPKDKPEVAVRFINFLIEQGVEEQTLKDIQEEVGDDPLSTAIDEVLEEYVDGDEDEPDDDW
tara:strand:+ start:1146 stop:1388 length:243 start_codon:yes stop_codon:yes gene_type:complete